MLESSLQRFNRSVSFLSWAYNEESYIASFLEKVVEILERTVEDYEIILVDDCSIDRTYDIARSFARINSRIKVFRNERNLNVGISSRKAILEAAKEFLFWQTVDWCYDISNLRAHLELLKQYDIVQGVRRKPVNVRSGLLKPFVALMKLFGIKHLTRRSDTIGKAIISVINYILIRLLFNVPLSDFQNVTFYPTKWIQSINFEAKSSFANPEGLIKSYWNGMLIKEVSISFIPRVKGKAKGATISSIIASLKDIFFLWIRWIVLNKRILKVKGRIYRLS